MANIPLSITEDQTLTCLRTWLLTVLDPSVQVIQAQGDDAAAPIGNYVLMTPLMRTRLATTVDGYGFQDALATTRTAVASTQVTVQLDAHGPGASDNVQIISTLFRDADAHDNFAAISVGLFEKTKPAGEPPNPGMAIAPLYTSDPRQAPFIDDAGVWEKRWTVDVHMQVNPVLTVPQQYADTVSAGLRSIDIYF